MATATLTRKFDLDRFVVLYHFIFFGISNGIVCVVYEWVSWAPTLSNITYVPLSWFSLSEEGKLLDQRKNE